MRSPTALCVLLLLASAPTQQPAQQPAQTKAAPDAYVALDCRKVERRLRKEPKYTAEPRYALFVLDLAGAFRVWMVADKSRADAPYYDVLYVDLDGDGDLTAPGERFVGKYDESLAPAGMAMTIRVGDLHVPGTALVHTKLLVSTSPKGGRTGFWFRMYWNGEHEMSGGYAPVGISTTTWAASAAAAPVFRPCPAG